MFPADSADFEPIYADEQPKTVFNQRPSAQNPRYLREMYSCGK